MYGPLPSSSDFLHRYKFGQQLEGKHRRKLRRKLTSPAAMFSENPVVSDVIATALSGGIALSLLRLWEETAKRGLFDQKLNRKLVHVSVGLAFMLCWPMFSSGRQGAVIAALVPAVNIIKMLLLGLGIWKDDATVKSMSRFGDHRELLKGPLYYASTITLVGAVYWRTSPIAIAAICNLCAGDGIADIVGRRFGKHKLPYNRNKSIVGSIAMATAGFLASIGYMHYFSSFGYVQESPEMVLGFFMVSLAAALVESHPLSTEIADNLTVPLASVLVGSFVL
ncbi:probable phytol kinase 3, chloroplastic [Olea europaea subsp. europaea]|uniref:Probable phytol kinase 3, chloroplastic n=1 Tax=Olea europaea subsp. europaea TaxID=158383 RepID=A0A8S0TEZ7_OLEEU|nr:probable phytol kinase 3, chloroplastic [Olea europaea subsp. europaea]